MLILRKRQHCCDPSDLLLDDLILERVERFKYLGVILTSDLSCSSHIESSCTKSWKLLGLLYHRFYKLHYCNFSFPDKTQPQVCEWCLGSSRTKRHKLIENVQKFGLRICSKQWDLGYDLITVFLTVSYVDYVTNSA